MATGILFAQCKTTVMRLSGKQDVSQLQYMLKKAGGYSVKTNTDMSLSL